MRKLVSTMLVAVAIIHLLPVAGVLGGERLTALYGVSIVDPNLEILMRHRAVLFGLIGAFLLAAAFKPALQSIAFAGGLISVASFLALAVSVGGYNAELGRVVAADLLALAGLAIGALACAVLRFRK